RQLGRVFVATFLKIAAQQDVLFHRFHVFLEGGDTGLGVIDGVTQTGGGLIHLGINFVVVDQGADGSVPLIDLAADGTEIGRGRGNVVQSLLAGVQDAVRLLHEVRDDQRGLRGDRIVIFQIGGVGGSKGNGDILVPQEALGLDGGYGVLLDDVVGRALEIHEHADFTGRQVGQLNSAPGSPLHTTYALLRASLEADYRSELRPQ